MAKTLRDVMSSNPVTMHTGTTVLEAARKMRDDDIGDVLVLRDGTVGGIVTDRDIVVRVLAEGLDPQSVSVSQIMSDDVECLSPDDSLERATELMRKKAIRRIPVVEAGQPIGIVSIGDLAVEADGERALADISKAPANN